VSRLDGTEPDWLLRARREIGVKERAGAAHHPRILEYHAATRLQAEADEVAWCSAFACWVMEQSGIASTRSAAARSWLTWGQRLLVPTPGCIVVLERPTPDNPHSGHVAFYVGQQDGKLLLLGGNQANQVCVRPYDESRVVGYRWPELP
jgi:uncharacterized protein (TIGR02594 family)